MSTPTSEILVGKFWLVWNPANRAPTKRHDTEAEARAEAHRLALANIGQSFVVLESQYELTIIIPQVTRLDHVAR